MTNSEILAYNVGADWASLHPAGEGVISAGNWSVGPATDLEVASRDHLGEVRWQRWCFRGALDYYLERR